MPIYDFICRDCEHRFDDLVNADEADAMSCGQCGSGDVVRVYAPFAVKKREAATVAAPMAGGGCMPGPAGGGGGGGCCGGGCGGCG